SRGSARAIAVTLVAAAAFAALIAWRVDAVGAIRASKTWLAGAIAAFALAFMRVPFHIYWRADAALLAQLPIEGRPLFDAALLRCVRGGVATASARLIGIVPLAFVGSTAPAEPAAAAAPATIDLVARHVGLTA